jgi:cytochrome c553
VLPGSVAKGEALVTTGGDGKTTPCTLCHGPKLKGTGEAPPIIDRTATYIFRQLNDMQSGARRGIGVQLMKPVVANLTEGDMIALAAYLRTCNP